MAAQCYEVDEGGWRCDGQIVSMDPDGKFACDLHAHELRAVVLYLTINGQVLMIKRQRKLELAWEPEPKFVDDYCLPGGKVEPGETDWEATVRETFEETGLDITDPIPLFSHSSYADSGRLVTAFTARLISAPLQDLRGNGREGEPEWGPPDLLVLGQCTYRKYNDALLTKLGVQL